MAQRREPRRPARRWCTAPTTARAVRASPQHRGRRSDRAHPDGRPAQLVPTHLQVAGPALVVRRVEHGVDPFGGEVVDRLQRQRGKSPRPWWSGWVAVSTARTIASRSPSRSKRPAEEGAERRSPRRRRPRPSPAKGRTGCPRASSEERPVALVTRPTQRTGRDAHDLVRVSPGSARHGPRPLRSVIPRGGGDRSRARRTPPRAPRQPPLRPPGRGSAAAGWLDLSRPLGHEGLPEELHDVTDAAIGDVAEVGVEVLPERLRRGDDLEAREVVDLVVGLLDRPPRLAGRSSSRSQATITSWSVCVATRCTGLTVMIHCSPGLTSCTASRTQRRSSTMAT